MPRLADVLTQLENLGNALVAAYKKSWADKRELEALERDIRSVVCLFEVADLGEAQGQYVLWHLLSSRVETLAKSATLKEPATAFIEAVFEVLGEQDVEVESENLASLGEKFGFLTEEDEPEDGDEDEDEDEEDE
jgi:hypothetical protein